MRVLTLPTVVEPFPRWEGANLQIGNTNLFGQYFFQKLHETERIWTMGVHVPGTPSDPANMYLLHQQTNIFSISRSFRKLGKFGFFTICLSDTFLSDYLTDLKHKINFTKNCHQWGLNSQPLDHKSNVLPD